MEETLRLHLLGCAEAYAAARAVTAATVGKLCLNDNTFFARVSDGQNFTIKTYDRVIAWFSENWPADAAWPGDVPRPDALAKVAA